MCILCACVRETNVGVGACGEGWVFLLFTVHSHTHIHHPTHPPTQSTAKEK